jgi:Flp pilus assembly pilin Flp
MYHAHWPALRPFFKLQSGQGMTEYALILALVVVVGLAT